MRDYSIKSERGQAIYDALKDNLLDKVKPDWVDLAVKVLKNPKNRLIILKGPAGTGKDVGADFIAAELGAPVIAQQWDAGIERADVTATTGINPTPGPEDTSPYKIVRGILHTAAAEGWCARISEANMAVPGVTTLLNGFTDGSKYFMEYDQMIPIHDNFFIILTLNPGYRGTFPFNPSTLTRAALTINVDAPGTTVEYTWLKKAPDEYEDDHEYKSYDFPKPVWDVIYKFSQDFLAYAAKNTDNVDVTFRQRKRIVDIILFDPFSIDNIQYAFLNGLFNSMGVNEDDIGKAKAFSNSPTSLEYYKKIANGLKAKWVPEPEPKVEYTPYHEERKSAEEAPKPKRTPAPAPEDPIGDAEIDSIIKEVMKDVKSKVLDEL